MCVGCTSLGAKICVTCLNQLKPLGSCRCLSCGNETKSIPYRCLQCEGKKETLQTLSLWSYESIIKKIVWAFKYKNDKQILVDLCMHIEQKILAELLILKEIHKDVIFVPVPLHPNRERERGYNQSAVFSALLSAITGIPTEKDAIVRRKETPSQTHCVSRKERSLNIRGAFFIPEKHKVPRSTVIIVDDVITTGSTVREIAREMKKYTKHTPLSLCIAREELDEKEVEI